MTPYYEQDGCTIYHGDCREILPTLTADVVLTDPPYGIEGGSGALHTDRAKGKYLGGFDDTPEYIEMVIVPVVRSLIATVPTVVITPGNRNFSLYPQPKSLGVFYQPAAVSLQSFGNLDAQPIFYYGKNGSGRIMGIPCSYVLTEAPESNGHPCPKPLVAWRRLLANVSKPGHLILDPFMGSGTTLRAAKDLGRLAIGIEIEERYCEIAANRLRQTVMDLEPVA